MSSNIYGTIFRILLIAISLILVWLVPILLFYYLFCLVMGISFSFNILFFIFALFILFRIFYPRNVFKS